MYTSEVLVQGRRERHRSRRDGRVEGWVASLSFDGGTGTLTCVNRRQSLRDVKLQKTHLTKDGRYRSSRTEETLRRRLMDEETREYQ